MVGITEEIYKARITKKTKPAVYFLALYKEL